MAVILHGASIAETGAGEGEGETWGRAPGEPSSEGKRPPPPAPQKKICAAFVFSVGFHSIPRNSHVMISTLGCFKERAISKLLISIILSTPDHVFDQKNPCFTVPTACQQETTWLCFPPDPIPFSQVTILHHRPPGGAPNHQLRTIPGGDMPLASSSHLPL